MTERRHPLDPDAVALAGDAARVRDATTEGVVPPGLADVIRRAAASVPDLDTREEAELAAALDALPEVGESSTAAFGGLEDFIDAARHNADALTQTRSRAPLPPLPRPAPTRRRAWPVLLAAAALLLLAPLVWAGLSSTRLDAAPPIETSGEAALQSLERQDASARAVEREPDPPQPVPRSRPEEPEPEPEIEVEVEDPPPAPDPPAGGRPSTSRVDWLAELDAEARAAWKVGDLGLAEDKFQQLVRIGRRGKAVDLAYGDLFSIARQRNDRPGLRRYWKQYVSKFPRGRWIDDARAGLCRTAAAGEAQACWRAYLADRPRGTYRADAEAALREP